MKLATWNVNSLNVRLPHVLDWLNEHRPDVLCLQELKQENAKFPIVALEEIGYHSVFEGQKTYNGVAILSRTPITDVSKGMPDFPDEQKRVIAATVNGMRVICVYIPNGQNVESEKYQYKLKWLDALIAYVQQEMAQYPALALLGDYNIAPADADVHDPVLWAGQVLCTDAERSAFRRLIGLGLHDAFRLFDQPEKSFTWWDYRMLGFRRNHGLRIDHILLSHALKPVCIECVIDKLPRKREQPSDHAPVFVTLNAQRLTLNAHHPDPVPAPESCG